MAMDINNQRPEVSSSSPTTIEKPKKEVKSSGKMMNIIITVVVIIILLVVAGYLVDRYTSVNLFGGGEGTVAGTSVVSKYKAVFLSNGQVYFGRVAEKDASSTVLTDIYYLQVLNALQQQSAGQDSQQQQLSLVKLGNELHGPVDEMVINNDHILFTEDLKEDGRVVQAIVNYETGEQAQQ